MSEMRANKQTWGVSALFGGEWDAGYTPKRPGIKQGFFTARRMEKNWEVVFHLSNGDREEILAKNLAVENLHEVWIRVK